MGRPRSWTDDELRKAVAAASTWGDVARGIGRVDDGKSRRFIQAHAVRLGLDLSHLPPFKPIEAAALHEDSLKSGIDGLAELIPEVSSWAEALRRLNIGISGAGYRKVQAAVGDAGLDTSHFRGQGWTAKPVRAASIPFQRARNERNLQKSASVIAARWFLERGYMVSLPLEPTLYDMVAESDDGLAKIQVKSTTSRGKTGHWEVRVCRQSYDRAANSGRARRCYSDGEVDYFFVVTADGNKYLIPLGAVKGIWTLTLGDKYSRFQVP